MTTRILITGAQGFTGRYLAALLRQSGYDVVALQADIRELDVLVNEVKAVNPTHIVHLAGIATLDGKDINIYKVHLIGSGKFAQSVYGNCHACKSSYCISIRMCMALVKAIIRSMSRPRQRHTLTMPLASTLWSVLLPIARIAFDYLPTFHYTGYGPGAF